MKKRIFFVLTAVILLLGAFAMQAAAAEELTDVYLATTGDDANAGTADAPVASLNQALTLVADGGTVHIVDQYVAPEGFVWANHGKDVTITGGKLDLSAGYTEGTDGGAPFYYYAQGDAVTYDDLELVLKDDLYYFANGFRLQINENVTVTGKDLQLFGGGFKTAVAGTDIKLLGGSYLCDDGYASIYGGGYKADVNGDVSVYVGKINPGYTASHSGKTRLYGGGYVYSGTNQIQGDIRLTIAGANVDRVCGVSHVTSAVAGDVQVCMSGGSVYSLVSGGGGNCAIAGDIHLTMTGGTAAQVFGANEGAGHTGNVTVKLQGGTITRRFFGGCYNEYDLSGFVSSNHVSGNVSVFLYEGMTLNWNASEADTGFFAHSRHDPLFDDEVTGLYYMTTAAQEKHQALVGAQNSGMRMVMGSAAVADSIGVPATKVEQWNVVLSDDIGANFYFKLPEAVAKLSQVKVTVKDKTESFDLSRIAPDADGLYKIRVKVAAAQMTEPIVLQLVVDGVEYDTVSYTVRQYAETILTGNYDPEVQALVMHMLNYGTAAQNYFGVNTGLPANAEYVLDYTAQFPDPYPVLSVQGQLEGVSFYGATLVMESKIAVRYYFEAETVSGVTFTANGVAYTAQEGRGMFYVEIPGIDPYEYDRVILLQAAKGEEKLEVAYSPLTYIVRMSEKGSQTLKPLVNAMYGYHEAAVSYIKKFGATLQIPAVTGGTVTSDKSFYRAGQTVTLTAVPNSGYDLTALTVKKDGKTVKSFATQLRGGTYTFAPSEGGSYTVEAVFQTDTVLKATDTERVLWSAAVKHTEGADYVERGDTTGLYHDAPRIDNLLERAPGKFNATGSPWPWIAYKITVPADGTYTLGVTTNSCKWEGFKIPMVVDHQVYTLTYTAKAQTQTAEVSLPAGEHIVTVFWPMPANESEVYANADWNTYLWANIASMKVDYLLSVSKPTAQEVEAVMVPNTVLAATDGESLLWSAAMGDNGNGYLEFNGRDAVKADMPMIHTLLDAAPGQFNKSGEEWGWLALRVSAPADGNYTLTLQNHACRSNGYDLPVYADGKVYTLHYTTSGRQAVSAQLALTAGEHTVVIFMPMPASTSQATGEGWVDYPWCNVEKITVDALLQVQKPTAEQVEACFPPDVVIPAVDGQKILVSSSVNVADTYLGRTDQSAIAADKASISTLYTDASGQFQVAGQVWNWFAFKVTAPADGSYTLGVKTSGSKYATYKMPLCVGGQVYTLQYTAAAQLATAEVALTAGEQVVTVFWPMPATQADNTGNAWNDYHWVNVESVSVDPKLTTALPTVAEVEACFAMQTYSAPDTGYVLRSAAVKYTAGNAYVERGSTTGVHEDTPRFDTLLELAPGNFNETGKEWLWIAYKLHVPADGTYTLGLTTAGSKYASYKMPMVIGGQLHTLSFTATSQTVTTEVTLPAGDHIVTVFWPMPEDETKVDASNANNYIWCNVKAVTVDYSLTITAPTAAEVEDCFPVAAQE